MAEHKAGPLQLQWTRQGGNLVINMVAPIDDQKAIIIRSWILSPNEEVSLRQALSGIIIAGNHK